MSHQFNVDMYRSQLRALTDPMADTIIERQLTDLNERLTTIQAQIARLEDERDNRPAKIETCRANLKDALKRQRIHAHRAKIEKLKALAAKIQLMEDETNAPQDA